MDEKGEVTMERGTSKVSDRIRLNVTQLKQRIIHLQAELRKYKWKLKHYQEDDKFNAIERLKKEREDLKHLLKEQQIVNEEIHSKNEQLIKEKEEYEQKFLNLQLQLGTEKKSNEHDENAKRLDMLEEKIMEYSQKVGDSLQQYESANKRIKHQDKELAKIELLLTRVEDYSKNKIAEQLTTLKSKVSEIEEKIVKIENIR
jgi:chromosome segregation ATPase